MLLNITRYRGFCQMRASPWRVTLSLQFADYASEFRPLSWSRSAVIVSGSNRRSLILTVRRLLGHRAILSDPSSGAFCRGHQVIGLGHTGTYIIISHLYDQRNCRTPEDQVFRGKTLGALR